MTDDEHAEDDETMGAGEADDREATFEEALGELETIVAQLEEGKLPLDEAITRFEAGLRLLKACRTRLDEAELRVRDLLGSTDPADSTEA